MHTPVLLSETIDLLHIKSNGVYVDCTSGRGGHSEAILAKLSKKGKLICIDTDNEAVAYLKNKFNRIKNVYVVKGNFNHITQLLNSLGISKVDGVLADLGVSSPQLDNIERGFSYHKDAHLDMRMDQDQEIDAQWIINNYDQRQLIEMFRKYGEIANPIPVVKAIMEYRKNGTIKSTSELVNIIKSNVNIRKQFDEKHPARQYFQAIRICVNDELESLKRFLNQLPDLLNKHGTIAIITFHSLEDRIVKNTFIEWTTNSIPKEVPTLTDTSLFTLINRKPIIASQEEIGVNRRSRSAKLRGTIKK